MKRNNVKYEIMNFKFEGDKVFFKSDTHFNHANIIDFCKRPFGSVEEMNEALIAHAVPNSI